MVEIKGSAVGTLLKCVRQRVRSSEVCDEDLNVFVLFQKAQIIIVSSSAEQ